MNASNEWGACPAGELQGFATRLRKTEQRRQQMAIGRTAGLTAVASACLVLAIGFVTNSPMPALGGLSCEACQASFDAYHQHSLTGEEPAGPSIAQINAHFGGCDACRDMYDQMHPGTRQVSVSKPTGLVAQAF